MSENRAMHESSENIPEGRRRVYLDFAPEAYDKLNQLRDTTGARTNAEVVRNALRLLEWFFEQKRKNYRLQLSDGDSVKEVELIF